MPQSMQSMDDFLKSDPAAKNTLAGQGVPAFYVRSVDSLNNPPEQTPVNNPIPSAHPTSADSRPQPDVAALPSTALPNSIGDVTIGGVPLTDPGAPGSKFQPGNRQFSFDTGDSGLLRANLVKTDGPGDNPYPRDPKTSGSAR